MWTLASGANGVLLTAAQAAVLATTIYVAVYHAEVVAHRVGEPFGTLVLALTVTVIETALIVSVMLDNEVNASTLARDTVFAVVMIILNGLVGLCLLVGGVRHRKQDFQAQGASSALSVLTTIFILFLVLPNFTSSATGPMFTDAQLAFAGTVSLVLYCVFVLVQTVRHRDFFLPGADARENEDAHAPPPTINTSLLSAALLLASLFAAVGLTKVLTPTLYASMVRLEAPVAIVGIVIAMLVLLPEGRAAVQAARANRLQTSLNLALGSALASIGLTIPAVATAAIVLGQPLALGLGPKEMVLLAATLLISVLTLGTGRTTVLQGAIHLVILALFLFLAAAP